MQPRIPSKLKALAVALVLTAGCSHLNNPYKDSSAAIEGDMTTASAEGARSVRSQRIPRDVRKYLKGGRGAAEGVPVRRGERNACVPKGSNANP